MKYYVTDQGIARAAADGALELLDLPYADLGAWLAAEGGRALVRDVPVARRVSLADVRLRAPVARPGKLIGIAINYHSHVEEMRELMERMGASVPEDPVFFLCPSGAVIGPDEDVVPPEIAPDQLDYEVELAAVIGRGGRCIAEVDALEHVAGYTVCNDVTARDVQVKAMLGHEVSLTHAKGMDGFKPLGPALVTSDQFSDPIDIHLEARVNGELRQDARTTDFIHPLPRVISHISRYMRLDPGDVISTGSPAGIGFFSRTFLRPGDVMELTADGIGTLRNRVA